MSPAAGCAGWMPPCVGHSRVCPRDDARGQLPLSCRHPRVLLCVARPSAPVRGIASLLERPPPPPAALIHPLVALPDVGTLHWARGNVVRFNYEEPKGKFHHYQARPLRARCPLRDVTPSAFVRTLQTRDM